MMRPRGFARVLRPRIHPTSPAAGSLAGSDLESSAREAIRIYRAREKNSFACLCGTVFWLQVFLWKEQSEIYRADRVRFRDMCVPSLLSCTSDTWPRSTSGRCKRTSRSPPPPGSCSLCRSTSGRNRRHRDWCRCTVARECPECRAWDSSRRTAATAPDRRGLSVQGVCVPDCTALTGSCSAAGVWDRRDADARSCSPNWRAHYCARDPNCWPLPGRPRRSGPLDYRRPRGNLADASSKFSLYTSPTYRDTCTPDAFPKTRAVTRRRRNPVMFLFDLDWISPYFFTSFVSNRFKLNTIYLTNLKMCKIKKNIIYCECWILRLKENFLFELEWRKLFKLL